MEDGLKLPRAAHTSRPWRIHDIVPDFRIEDVWQFPGRGGPADFPRAVELVASYDPATSSSRAVRTLFSARWRIGAVLGWDDPADGLGFRVATLRERLPEDLCARAGPEFHALPFTSLYQTEEEFAAEIANSTMHGVMHLGSVPDGSGGYRVNVAVLVKPNGMSGNAYMAAIRPFRHLIVYPAVMREARGLWDRHSLTSPRHE